MIIRGPLLFPRNGYRLGQRPKGSWQFMFNIKHPGGSQRQRYRFRTAAGCYV